MKQKLLNMLVVLTAIASSASAQTLSIAPIEAEAGAKAELVVTGASIGSVVTALQFNLMLPEGITLDEAAITKGTAASGHELSVSTLSSGDRLFVLYNMNLDYIGNGELLRLPITVNGDVGTKTGRIRLFRTATADAVSHTGTGATFPIKVTDEATAIDASLNDNGKMTNDSYYSIDGVKLSGEPRKKGVYIYNGKKVVK